MTNRVFFWAVCASLVLGTGRNHTISEDSIFAEGTIEYDLWIGEDNPKSPRYDIPRIIMVYPDTPSPPNIRAGHTPRFSPLINPLMSPTHVDADLETGSTPTGQRRDSSLETVSWNNPSHLADVLNGVVQEEMTKGDNRQDESRGRVMQCACIGGCTVGMIGSVFAVLYFLFPSSFS